MNNKFKKGEIYFFYKRADYTIHSSGYPMLIISSEEVNSTTGFVNVIPITFSNTKPLLTHYQLNSSNYDGYVICETINRMPIDSIGDFITSLSKTDLDEVNKRLAIVLEMDRKDYKTDEYIQAYLKEFYSSQNQINDEKEEYAQSLLSKEKEIYEKKIMELNSKLEVSEKRVEEEQKNNQKLTEQMKSIVYKDQTEDIEKMTVILNQKESEIKRLRELSLQGNNNPSVENKMLQIELNMYKEKCKELMQAMI